MRAIVLTTSTPDTEKLISSFTALHPATEVIRYDVPGVDVARIAEERRPDFIVYIGAIRQFHNQWVPDAETLARANRAAPMVHICSDAADPPWWPVLEEYHAAKSFRLQVSIDGCHDSPMARLGMVALTPVDPSWFPETPWHHRIHPCGFAGGVGHRAALLETLERAGLLERLPPGSQTRYDHMCAFYSLCRLVVNDARTGTGERRHVKGRFVEAALAGAVPIEPHDSPASDWFKPGIDYLVWRDPEDAARHIREQHPGNQRMARRLRAQMLERHAGPAFWKRVMKAAL